MRTEGSQSEYQRIARGRSAMRRRVDGHIDENSYRHVPILSIMTINRIRSDWLSYNRSHVYPIQVNRTIFWDLLPLYIPRQRTRDVNDRFDSSWK